MIDDIKAHINSFPKYKSHYSREDNPHREFLSPSLTLQKMYVLYKEKCEGEGNVHVASDWIYRKVFNEHFNLSFGRYVAIHMHSLSPLLLPLTHAHTHSYVHTRTHAHTHTLTHTRTHMHAHAH